MMVGKPIDAILPLHDLEVCEWRSHDIFIVTSYHLHCLLHDPQRGSRHTFGRLIIRPSVASSSSRVSLVIQASPVLHLTFLPHLHLSSQVYSLKPSASENAR